MIKFFLIYFFLISFIGCNSKSQTAEYSDDYVLIEFAAKLEEDHNRSKSQSLDEGIQSPN